MSAVAPLPIPDPEQEPGPALEAVADSPADDVSSWDDDRLVAEITAAERSARAGAARVARLTAAFAGRHPERSEGPAEDDLSLVALDELSVATGLARGAFAYRLREAVALQARFPRLLDAWEAGLVSSTAVRRVLERTVGVPDETCPRLEAELLGWLGGPSHDLAQLDLQQMRALDDGAAMTLSSRATSAAVLRILRSLLARLAPAARLARHQVAKARRRVLFEAFEDGMSRLGLDVPQAVGWASYERIDALARALPEDADDPRTLDAKRADVLVDLIFGTSVDRSGHIWHTDEGDDLAAGHRSGPSAAPTEAAFEPPAQPDPGRRPVMAPVALQVLLDHTRCRPDAGCVGEAGRLGPVTAETIIDLLAVVLDTGGLIDGGHVIDQPCPGADHHASHGPGPYTPPEALKRFLRARHRRCTWPGCDRPARSCELDHSIPYSQGGPTCECNMAPKCVYHHHVKHHPGRDGRPGWRLVNHGQGHLTWVTPGGREIDVWPDPPDDPDPPPYTGPPPPF